MCEDISANYLEYDAFVVLHGTDTMAYTASTLSFMLENLGKTVVVTGSQIPLSVPLNDGINNLLGAITVAGHYEVPEVLLYFNSKAMRGNRSTKQSASALGAFNSPNFDPLIEIGVDYTVRWEKMISPSGGQFAIQTALDPNLAVYRLYPGFTVSSLRNILQPPLRGLVMQVGVCYSAVGDTLTSRPSAA
jgi:L-asparaginase/Glu-tRNA(Gln) amidotransferase subunit D